MSIKLGRSFASRIFVICLVFILALALLDFAAMHLSTGPGQLYRYWISLTFVIIVFGFALSYGYWMGTTKKMANPYIIPGIFFTVILLYIAGILDIFYFLLTRKYGKPYGFEIWSAGWKWFGYWDWNLQILWSTFFILLIILMWWIILKKGKVRMFKHA